MPTKAYWDAERPCVIHMDYEGDWTWDEYFQVAEDARTMALTYSGTVHYICDFRNGHQPSGGSPLVNGKIVMRKRSPNSGLVINVTTMITSILLNVFKRLDAELGESMVGVKTMEDAYALVDKVRAEETMKV